MILEQFSFKKKSTQKSIKLIILLVVITISISTELIIKDYLFSESIVLIEKLNSIFNKGFQDFFKYVSLLGSQYFFFTVIFILYNFVNIYKTYILLTLNLSTILIANILNLLYSEPEPYYSTKNSITPYFCNMEYGNPSSTVMCSIVFYCSFYRVIISPLYKVNKIHKSKTRLLIVFILLSVITFITISQFILGINSINQLLNSIFFGCVIFFISFQILNIDGNNAKQFVSFVENGTYLYILVHAVMITIISLILIFRDNFDKTEKIWLNEMRKKCGDFPISQALENQCFLGMAAYFSNLGCYIGLKCEYIFTFKKNTQNFQNFNFSKVHHESLLSALALEKDTQWNHTKKFVSCFRILINLLFCILPLMCFFYVNWTDNLLNVLLFKIFVPLTLILYGFFFYVKFLMKYFGLVNSYVLLFNSHIEEN